MDTAKVTCPFCSQSQTIQDDCRCFCGATFSVVSVPLNNIERIWNVLVGMAHILLTLRMFVVMFNPDSQPGFNPRPELAESSAYQAGRWIASGYVAWWFWLSYPCVYLVRRSQKLQIFCTDGSKRFSCPWKPWDWRMVIWWYFVLVAPTGVINLFSCISTFGVVSLHRSLFTGLIAILLLPLAGLSARFLFVNRAIPVMEVVGNG